MSFDFSHLFRGSNTLAWAWPDQTLVGRDLTQRHSQLETTSAPGQRVALVSECPGKLELPYCKKLVLSGAQAKDTGYYRCSYKDAKAIIEGTTATSIYVFVMGESHKPANVLTLTLNLDVCGFILLLNLFWKRANFIPLLDLVRSSLAWLCGTFSPYFCFLW